MKKIPLSILAGVLLSATSANAAIGIDLNAIVDSSGGVNTGILSGDVGIWLITDGTSFGTISVTEGDNIFTSATYGGAFTYFGTNTASEFFGTVSVGSGQTTDFANAGLSFALLVYENSTTTAQVGDAYRIWTHASWNLPTTNGVSFDFEPSPGTATEIQQLTGASSFSGTVQAIPEPSAFLLTGLGGLMLLRRRRND